MRVLLMMLAMVLPLPGWAQEGPVRLFAPPELTQSGLIPYILPRFSLKTQVRVTLAEGAEAADIVLGDDGQALFQDGERVWQMRLRSPDHAGAARLADWLTGEIGRNTILGFAPEGTPLYTAPRQAARETVEVALEGDAAEGLRIATAQCARCHVVDPERRGGIGSTPSFAVLRGFDDWDSRFAAFYALNPHPAFTQVDGVTDPFPQNLPPAIVPLELTLDDLENLMAYVGALDAADLGGPLVHQ